MPVEGGLAGEARDASTRAAARLTFSPTPLRPFLGFAPDGGAVRFTEHAFTRLVDALIAEAWSLLDRAFASQLTGDEPGRQIKANGLEPAFPSFRVIYRLRHKFFV